MISAARKLQSLGFAVLLLLVLGMIYPLSLRVATTRSDVMLVERDIVHARENIRYLETELGARASLRQLERWNADVFGYSAPTAGQYLAGERALANLDSPKGGSNLPIVAPVLTAMANAPSAASASNAGAKATPQGLAIAQRVEAPVPRAEAVVMAARSAPPPRPTVKSSVQIIAQAQAATPKARPDAAKSAKSPSGVPKSIADRAQDRRDTRSAMLEERLIGASTWGDLERRQKPEQQSSAKIAPKPASKPAAKPPAAKPTAAKPTAAKNTAAVRKPAKP